MNWLKENWFKIAVMFILVFIINGVFYWFQWRPTQVRKECAEKFQDREIEFGRLYKGSNRYLDCLHEKGLSR